VANKSGRPENKRGGPVKAPRSSERSSRPSEPGKESRSSNRTRVTTLGYQERPRVPGPRTAPFGSSPELITVDESGRATLAFIEDALRTERLDPGPARPRQVSSSVPEPAFIFEVSTFVVEGAEVFTKASDGARRDFVAKRLLHRLPVLSINDVERIDLSPGAAPNTAILRIWSRVDVSSR
jgi:hypothetical protein